MFSNLTKEKIFFTRHLYIMLKGGFLVSDAIELLKEEVRSERFKRALNDILKRLLEGESLHKSLSYHPAIFGKFYQNIVKIGEESGSLEQNFRYLASQLSSDYEIKKKIQGALSYPLIVVILALFIGFGVNIFILPKLLSIFSSLDIALPWTTRILITTSSFFEHYWIWVLLGILLLGAGYRILLRLKEVRYLRDNIVLSLPVAGTISRNILLSQFSQSFYTLLKSGVPILEAIEIIAQTTINEVFKKNLLLVKIEIEKGGKLSQGLLGFPKTFPLIFSQMISVGEKSGSLEDSFKYLSKFYQKEVDSSLKSITDILEPLLLIIVGLFVAFIALAIITPIYQFSGSLNLH